MNAKGSKNTQIKHPRILGSCVVLIVAAFFGLILFKNVPAAASASRLADSPLKSTLPAALAFDTPEAQPALLDLITKVPLPVGTSLPSPAKTTFVTPFIPTAKPDSRRATVPVSPTASDATPGKKGLVLVFTHRQTTVAPGESVTLTLSIVNTSGVATKVRLRTRDSNPTFFVSKIDKTHFVLAPGETVTRYVTVKSSPNTSNEMVNTTRVEEKRRGGAHARAKVSAAKGPVQLARVMEGIGVSNLAVSPDTNVQMQVGVQAGSTFTRSVLIEYLPRAWTITEAGGATLSTVDAETQKLEWDLPTVDAAIGLTKTYSVSSPSMVYVGTEYTFQTKLVTDTDEFSATPWIVRLQHPLIAKHFRIGRNTPLDKMRFRAPTDKPPKKLPRFRAFRVRFQVVNSQSVPVRWQPRLEWSRTGQGEYRPLGKDASLKNSPFYLYAVETVSDGAPIAVENLMMDPGNYTPQPGMELTQLNPGPVLILKASSVTEIEFSVRATVRARYRHKYFFRLSDDGRELKGRAARVIMGAHPGPKLTLPQYSGLASGFKKAKRPKAPDESKEGDPHRSKTVVDANCAVCHRSHTAENRNLLAQVEPQSNLCFTCHDGSRAGDIQGQFTDPNVPANDPTTGIFYSHPGTANSTHTQAVIDEFKGVLNRHSECSDCHDSHRGTRALASATAKGYTVSGAQLLISGVRVKQDRTLVWRSAIKYEYELCYKCHSSYTTLLSYEKPSNQLTDIAAAFNPANPSYHPIERAGANTSPVMTKNLQGPSPYKLWNFKPSDVVRCVNCHGDYRLANPVSPPMVNAPLAPHASENSDILMNNYRNRKLKPRNQPYRAADFALCYQCHSEAPYADPTGGRRTDTAYRFHGFHLTKLGTKGSGGVDINTGGDGQGNAICAECHFQPHGQDTSARGNPSGLHLLNFAPNVQPNSAGVLKWDSNSRTCTLLCHGQEHNGWGY